MEYQLITLSNGLRIVFKPVRSVIAHACLLVNTGSRDEKHGTFGMAHFIEHLLFKRTEKRSTNQILNRLEQVGADLNAYTTKEYTCLQASFLNQYLERSLDLFEDLVFHSTFPENEMVKEKGVILDEIDSYLDSPEEAIADDFEDLLFREHPLGHNILGTKEDLISIQRNDIVDFIKGNYLLEEMVIGIIGEYEEKKVKHLSEKLFGHLSAPAGRPNRASIPLLSAIQQTHKKPINQVHCSTGNQAYDLHHPKKIGLLLLNNYLGGMGMSSRLNLEIREKYGIAYTIESNYTPYSDTGIFSIYFGTDAEKAEKARKMVLKELRTLREKKLGNNQLHLAKQKFIGQIALGEENRMGLIISLAKSILDYQKAESMAEIFQKIQAVTADELLSIANEIFEESSLTSLFFVPSNEAF
ncbi:Predicted Zn-dependent peptidase [bacterium A37T11]|nr:Predicted Zn-dependent peptidase [bacterium A37T11]